MGRGLDQHVYLPLSDDSNIRLVTILPGRSTDDVLVLLDEHQFDEQQPPKYEAISYVWGSQADLATIRVGAHQVTSVTQYLFTALQHLRHESEQRVVWIDALAIDQSNAREKSAQVAMMAKIYRLAHRVVAWLGPESLRSNRAMELMKEIGDEVEMDWMTKILRPAPGCKDPSLADMVKPLKLSKKNVVALYELISRPWFGRLWIRQEVVLANDSAVIRCGHQEVLWKSFRNAMICLYLKAPFMEEQCPGAQNLFESLRGFILQGKYVALWDARQEFGSSKCQDPRDRIYAISNMLYPQERDLCPHPDYSSPVVDVYRQVILRHFSEFGDLELLRECELPADKDWPS